MQADRWSPFQGIEAQLNSPTEGVSWLAEPVGRCRDVWSVRQGRLGNENGYSGGGAGVLGRYTGLDVGPGWLVPVGPSKAVRWPSVVVARESRTQANRCRAGILRSLRSGPTPLGARVAQGCQRP
jgi:hypothetical protein